MGLLLALVYGVSIWRIYMASPAFIAAARFLNEVSAAHEHVHAVFRTLLLLTETFPLLLSGS